MKVSSFSAFVLLSSNFYFAAVLVMAFRKISTSSLSSYYNSTQLDEHNGLAVTNATEQQSAITNLNNNNNNNNSSRIKDGFNSEENLLQNVNKFTGSRKTQLSPSMDLFENVCIFRSKKKVEPILRSYGNSKRSMWHSHYNLIGSSHERFMAKTEGFPLQDWYNHSNNETNVVANDTIWTINPYYNIGHCMTDLIFSLALDRFHRTNANTTTSTSSVIIEGPPLYDNYLLGRYMQFDAPPYDKLHSKNHWCVEMMRAQGLVHPERGLLDVEVPQTCFKRLLIPAIRVYRYPLSRTADRLAVEHHLKMVVGVATVHRFSAPVLDYPIGALESVRDRGTHFFNLPKEPWPPKQSSSAAAAKVLLGGGGNTTMEDIIILLHVRPEGDKRRILNADELKEHLEEHYHATIDILREGWNFMNITDQACVYNGYQYIISGHGAHLANAIFCRAGTRIVEVFCGLQRRLEKLKMLPDPSLSEPPIFNGTESYSKWYGANDWPWFSSFTRRLGIEHFEQGHTDCGTNKNKHWQHISLDLTQVVPLIVNRFGLVPRDPNLLNNYGLPIENGVNPLIIENGVNPLISEIDKKGGLATS